MEIRKEQTGPGVNSTESKKHRSIINRKERHLKIYGDNLCARGGVRARPFRDKIGSSEDFTRVRRIPKCRVIASTGQRT